MKIVRVLVRFTQGMREWSTITSNNYPIPPLSHSHPFPTFSTSKAHEYVKAHSNGVCVCVVILNLWIQMLLFPLIQSGFLRDGCSGLVNFRGWVVIFLHHLKKTKTDSEKNHGLGDTSWLNWRWCPKEKSSKDRSTFASRWKRNFAMDSNWGTVPLQLE